MNRKYDILLTWYSLHFFAGSADPKQKPLLRHVIVKDLNKVGSEVLPLENSALHSE